MTNADRIRLMNNEQLAAFLTPCVDNSGAHNIGCYGCIYHGTHHADPANKGTSLYGCDGCSYEGIGQDVLTWLNAEYKEDKPE